RQSIYSCLHFFLTLGPLSVQASPLLPNVASAAMRGTLPDRINSANLPGEVFARYPEVFGDALPIHGGWGYSIHDAVIVDEENTTRGVRVEYEFVDKRNHAELVFFRPVDEILIEIDKKLLMQRVVSLDGRRYDVLKFELSVLPKRALDMLNAAKLNAGEYNRLRNKYALRLVREYWFDITGFYAKFGLLR